MRYDAHLVHEGVRGRVEPTGDGIVQRVFKVLLLANDRVQEVVAIDMWRLWLLVSVDVENAESTYELFVKVDLYHRLHRVSDVYQLEKL